MPRNPTYTDAALSDIEAVGRWLTQPGAGLRARRRLAAIWAAIEALREYPCRYPVRPHRGVRELPCDGGYRVLYRVHPDTGSNDTSGDVIVLRVYGPGQDRRRV